MNPRAIWLIAKSVLIEAIRRREIYSVIFIALMLIALIMTIDFFHLSGLSKFYREVALKIMSAATALSVVVLAALLGATEIAEVDRSIGELLAGLKKLAPDANTLIVFASDHGESLGEHDYWGHGRHLYEPTLHIPMAITWIGRIEPGT